MLISEIFSSIQGEGGLTGTPSAFVRTSGCNLRCEWCDTPYASWKPEGTEWTVPAIAAEVDRLGLRHVVLTGGEPMIAPGIHDLAARLRGNGRHITIETAGTIAPGGIACDMASLSPKLRNSTPSRERAGAWAARHEALRWQPDVLRAWMQACPWQMKFVVAEPHDVDEVCGLVAGMGMPVPPGRVFLMPEGTDAAILEARAKWLVPACREHGFQYGRRLHIELFGNRRGV